MKQETRRRRLLSRGAAHVSAGERRVRGDRLRRPRQQGPRGARADAGQATPRERRREDGRARPARARAERDRREEGRSTAATSTSPSTTRSSARSSRCSTRRGRSGTPRRRPRSSSILDTGGVLAMAVAPGFDANKYPTVSKDKQRNRAVTDTYEPGSTFKVVTLAGVLETGIVTPQDELRAAVLDRGRRPRDPRRRPRGTQRMTVARILSKLLERRHDHARARPRPGPAQQWIDEVRLRQRDRHRVPGRERRDRPPDRPLVGLHDRQRADRPGHRRDAAPDGAGLRRAREQGRRDPAASRGARRRRAREQKAKRQSGSCPRRPRARSAPC